MKSDEFRFLTLDQLDEIHTMVIRSDGGESGLHDFRNLELSTIAPQNLPPAEIVDAFDVAAAYAHSIIRNHPYENGNKRTALTAALVFLGCNGLADHHFDEACLERALLYFTTGRMTRASFAQYLRDAFDGSVGSWADDTESKPD